MLNPGANRIKNAVPLIIALLATFIPLILLEQQVLSHTGGIIVYPLDDTYIHMQVSKNLAMHGNWGINSNEFSSTSSSLLYTLLLAALFKIFSVNAIIPLVVNIIAAILLLLAMKNWLQKHRVSVTGQTFIFLLVVFFTPLPVLVISGMEHTLQCLICFLFVFHFSDWMEQHAKQKGRLPFSLLVYAFCLPAIRYEGLFLVMAAGLVLLYYKKLLPAVLLGFVALLPVLIFGFYSLGQSSYFFPNSLLVKSETTSLTPRGLAHFFGNILVNKLTVANFGITSLATQRLLMLLPLTCLAFAGFIGRKITYRFSMLILLATVLLHLSFAATGWFYRYEAYLVMCSVAAISVVCYHHGKILYQEKLRRLWPLALVLVFFLLFPFLLRSTAAYSKASRACINIYEQQYQMGHFLQRYYKADGVAANDIGAISFFTRNQILDLWGLGSIEVTRSRKNNYWTPGYLDSLCRKKNVRLAIVYDTWFTPNLLKRWNKVAEWQVEQNVILGGNTVSFYAIDTSVRKPLLVNLQDYEMKFLPRTVTVRYFP